VLVGWGGGEQFAGPDEESGGNLENVHMRGEVVRLMTESRGMCLSSMHYDELVRRAGETRLRRRGGRHIYYIMTGVGRGWRVFDKSTGTAMIPSSPTALSMQGSPTNCSGCSLIPERW